MRLNVDSRAQRRKKKKRRLNNDATIEADVVVDDDEDLLRGLVVSSRDSMRALRSVDDDLAGMNKRARQSNNNNNSNNARPIGIGIVSIGQSDHFILGLRSNGDVELLAHMQEHSGGRRGIGGGIGEGIGGGIGGGGVADNNCPTWLKVATLSLLYVGTFYVFAGVVYGSIKFFAAVFGLAKRLFIT